MIKKKTRLVNWLEINVKSVSSLHAGLAPLAQPQRRDKQPRRRVALNLVMLSGWLSPAGWARQTALLRSEGAPPACNFSLWLLLTDTSFSFRPFSFPSLRLLPPGQSAAVWNTSASPSLSLHSIAFLLIVAALRVFPSGFHPLSNHISFPALPASFTLIDSPHL